MMRERFVYCFVSMLVFGVEGCGNDDGTGAEGDSALVSFQAGLCKKHVDASSAPSPMWLDEIYEEQALAGFQCVSWAYEDDAVLRINLINFEEGCGAEWSGNAVVSDNRVKLTVENPECGQGGCGWCIYDWSFEVAGVDDSREAAVTIAVDDCPGESEIATFSASIPAGEQEGISCRYADHGAMVDQAMTLSEMGSLHMPCLGSEYPPEEQIELQCADNLVCTDVSRGIGEAPLCLAPCETEADCVLPPDLLGCEAGVCQIAEPWEG